MYPDPPLQNTIYISKNLFIHTKAEEEGLQCVFPGEVASDTIKALWWLIVKKTELIILRFTSHWSFTEHFKRLKSFWDFTACIYVTHYCSFKASSTLCISTIACSAFAHIDYSVPYLVTAESYEVLLFSFLKKCMYIHHYICLNRSIVTS